MFFGGDIWYLNYAKFSLVGFSNTTSPTLPTPTSFGVLNTECKWLLSFTPNPFIVFGSPMEQCFLHFMAGKRGSLVVTNLSWKLTRNSLSPEERYLVPRTLPLISKGDQSSGQFSTIPTSKISVPEYLWTGIEKARSPPLELDDSFLTTFSAEVCVLFLYI